MLGLLLPAGLIALLALALPALIHLARRSEERLTDFAALRWLSEKPKPRQRLRFDEWPLLLIRLLLLALVALWLARPVVDDVGDAERWIVVVPGVDLAKANPPESEGAQLRWLAPGFPAVEAGVTPAGGEVPVNSLLRELDATLPPAATVTVLAPERLTGLDGERPRLSRDIDWQVRPGAMAMPRRVEAEPPRLFVRYAPSEAGSVRYFSAAATAWQRPGRPLRFDAARQGAPLPGVGDVLVWLAPGAVPEHVTRWVARGGTALLTASADVAMSGAVDGPIAAERLLGRGRLLQMKRPLTPAAMPQLLEPGFPQLLAATVAPPLPPPSSAYASDVAPGRGGDRYSQPARELQPWLALLVASLLLVERWMATSRRRRPAP